jgi:hypothetical protein
MSVSAITAICDNNELKILDTGCRHRPVTRLARHDWRRSRYRCHFHCPSQIFGVTLCCHGGPLAPASAQRGLVEYEFHKVGRHIVKLHGKVLIVVREFRPEAR